MPKHYLPLIFFAILLMLEQFLASFKYNFFLQIICLIVVLISAKNLSINNALLKLIIPLILIFLIGCLGMPFSGSGLAPIIKDITYFLQPMMALLLGYFVFKSQKKADSILKFIVYFGCFLAVLHFFGILFFGNLAGNSIHKIRGIFGLDNFIEVFAFYILIFNKQFFGYAFIKNQKLYYALILILLGSIFLYFSRTMLIILVLTGISLLGYTKITKQLISYFLLSLLCIGLLFVYLNQLKLNRNSKGFEGFLYKVKIAPQEIFNTKINKSDHKQLWDRYRAYEAKRALELMVNQPISYVVGMGHGSLVNLGFKAPLGDEDLKFISKIHNGYVFVFYKTGILGLFIYLYLLVKIFMYNKKPYADNQQKMINYLISSIGLFYLFSSVIITGIYIPRDMIIFLLGGLLPLYATKNQLNSA